MCLDTITTGGYTKGVVCETGTLKLSLLSVEAFGLVLLNNVKLDYIVYVCVSLFALPLKYILVS
jgi:hypothetical protein